MNQRQLRPCIKLSVVRNHTFAIRPAIVEVDWRYAADALDNRYNDARTGAVLDETVLTTANVRSATFGKRWALCVDGQIGPAPVVSNQAVDTAANPNTPRVTGTFNAVIVATMHDTVSSPMRPRTLNERLEIVFSDGLDWLVARAALNRGRCSLA